MSQSAVRTWKTQSKRVFLSTLAMLAWSCACHAHTTMTHDRAIAIATADARQHYRDLSPYRVEARTHDDAWYVDFVLRNWMQNGGGPHYVISSDGRIVSRRYEQ